MPNWVIGDCARFIEVLSSANHARALLTSSEKNVNLAAAIVASMKKVRETTVVPEIRKQAQQLAGVQLAEIGEASADNTVNKAFTDSFECDR